MSTSDGETRPEDVTNIFTERSVSDTRRSSKKHGASRAPFGRTNLASVLLSLAVLAATIAVVNIA